MAQDAKLEIAKVLVAPGIALFVAAVGWGLTARYNATQLDVATQRGAADVEIARINAAMRYMELIGTLPAEAAEQRRQAVSIAVPVLPPELAFRLAIDQLPADTDAIDALMHKYGIGAFAYLVRPLEVPFRAMRRVLGPIPESGPFATQPTEPERRVTGLLRYLRGRGQSEALFNYLVSRGYGNEEFRPIALTFYFDEYRSSLQDDAGYVVQQAYERVRLEEEFRSYLGDKTLAAEAKQSIVFAVALVFGQKYQYQTDIFVREAAARFWEGVDIARGATPVEGTLRAYLYERVFHYNDPPGTEDWFRGEAVPVASARLRDAIRGLRLSSMNFDNVRLILYGYAASPTVGGDPAYLSPSDVVEVMRVILGWANTPERRKELSMELGSLSGHHIFLNMLPGRQPNQEFAKEEDDRARCAAARAYAELLLEWYGKYHVSEWFIPKFFDDVVNEFPDLENRINRQAWGLGKAWPAASGRGCRK